MARFATSPRARSPARLRSNAARLDKRLFTSAGLPPERGEPAGAARRVLWRPRAGGQPERARVSPESSRARASSSAYRPQPVRRIRPACIASLSAQEVAEIAAPHLAVLGQRAAS